MTPAWQRAAGPHISPIAPLTRTIRGVASEVVVGADSGLNGASAINLHHVVTVPKTGLRRFVGSVSPAVLEQVRAALQFALDFDGHQHISILSNITRFNE